jgi:hypothetical protein
MALSLSEPVRVGLFAAALVGMSQQSWDDYKAHEEAVLKKWRLWWNDEGQAYMTEPVTRPENG